MKCFSFYIGDKKEEPKTTKSVSVQSVNSTFTDREVGRSGSELNSQDGSGTITESIGRPSFPSMSQRPSNLRVFTVSELRSATKNFSRSVMLGEGGFGCVYRGSIKSVEDPTNKIEVAVKQLGKRGMQASLVMVLLFWKLVIDDMEKKLFHYCFCLAKCSISLLYLLGKFNLATFQLFVQISQEVPILAQFSQKTKTFRLNFLIY